MHDKSAISIEHSDFQTAQPGKQSGTFTAPAEFIGFDNFSPTVREGVRELGCGKRLTRKAVFLSTIISLFLKGSPPPSTFFHRLIFIPRQKYDA